MNTTGKIKAGVLVIAFLLNIIFPSPPDPDQNSLLLFSFLAFIIPLLVIPIIIKINLWASYRTFYIYKPDWNDNPLSNKRPLVFFHFTAYMIIMTAFGLFTGTCLKYHELNVVALAPMAFGIGGLLGVKLTVLWIPDNRDSN